MASFKTSLAGVKIFLINGQNDDLVAPKDFKKLIAVMHSSAKVKTVEDYNHLDYMWAQDVNELVNADVLEFLASL